MSLLQKYTVHQHIESSTHRDPCIHTSFWWVEILVDGWWMGKKMKEQSSKIIDIASYVVCI